MVRQSLAVGSLGHQNGCSTRESRGSRLRVWRNRRPSIIKLGIKLFFPLGTRSGLVLFCFWKFARNLLDGSKAFQRVGLLTDSHSALSFLMGEMTT